MAVTDNLPTADTGAGAAGVKLRGALQAVPGMIKNAAGDAVVAGAKGVDYAMAPANFVTGLAGGVPASPTFYEEGVQRELGRPPSATSALPTLLPNTTANSGPDANRSANIEAIQQTRPAATAEEEDSISPEGTVNVMPLGGTDLRLSRELSAARQAAAARGDFESVNASYGKGGLTGDWKPPSATAAFEPSSIGDLIQMKWDNAAQQHQQKQQLAQAQLAMTGQQIQGQQANYASEAELRKAQAGEIAGKGVADAQKQSWLKEYLDPNTPEARRDILGPLVGAQAKDKWTPEKNIMGEPTGRFFNAATGEYKSDSSTAVKPAEGTTSTSGGQAIIFKNGAWTLKG